MGVGGEGGVRIPGGGEGRGELTVGMVNEAGAACSAEGHVGATGLNVVFGITTGI